MDTEEDNSIVSSQQGEECVLDELHGITSAKKKEFAEFKQKVESLKNANCRITRRKKKRLETWTPEMVEIFQTRHFSDSKYLNSQSDLQIIGPFQICSSDPINYKMISQETEVTILDCDDILRETISFLDYYSLNKMSYVSKGVNRIVTSLKKQAAQDLMNKMPFDVDVHRSLGTPLYCPTFHFKKSWDPKYNDFDILDFDRYPDGHPVIDLIMDFMKRFELFQYWSYNEETDEVNWETMEIFAVAVWHCLHEYSSFSTQTVLNYIMEDPELSANFIQEDHRENDWIGIHVIPRRRATLKEAWELLVDRVVFDVGMKELDESSRRRINNRSSSRKYMIYNLLSAADPSSIYISHIHMSAIWGVCTTNEYAYDNIAISFLVNGERLEFSGFVYNIG